MEWDEEQEHTLEKTEELLRTFRKVIDRENEWLRMVKNTYDPDLLPTGLTRRISDVMWRIEMLTPIVHADNAGAAFHDYMKWIQEFNLKGVHIQEIDNEDDLDDIVLAGEKARLERERYERGSEDE